MPRTFHGRPVIPGNLISRIVVEREPFNITENYSDTAFSFSAPYKGKIMCLPQAIGSTWGGVFLWCEVVTNKAPLAMLFSRHIDPIAACAVSLIKVWGKKDIITVDSLGDEFLSYARTGMEVEIVSDGRVIMP